MFDRDLIERLVGSAVLAPSSHNTQPWIFEIGDSGLRLIADRTRALPVNDPDDRELVISCGCALLNLRAAAAKEGLGANVSLLPDEEDEDVLAEVSLSGSADQELAGLAEAISERRTYRKRFLPKTVPDDVVTALLAAADVEGARLVPLIGEDTRKAAARLVAEGDAIQWSNPSWRRELAQWMHPRRKGDGLSLPWLAVPAAQIVVRSFDMGGGIGAKDSDLAENSPLLAVLTTPADDVANRLAAGQALERVLLTAAAVGLQASYLNQPVQAPDLRQRLASLCAGKSVPQILMRLGYPGDSLPAAVRRPLEEVIKPRSG